MLEDMKNLVLILLLSISNLIYAKGNVCIFSGLPFNYDVYGFEAKLGRCEKIVVPNFPEDNKGKKVAITGIGGISYQMIVYPNEKNAIIFINIAGYLERCFAKFENDWRDGIFLEIDNDRYEINSVKDRLGRIISFKFGNTLGYDDTYISDGYLYIIEYYGDTDKVRTLHITGWGDYPKDRVLRESKFPETIGCRPKNSLWLYLYDTQEKTVTRTLLNSNNEMELRNPKDSYTMTEPCDIKEILERDCNGNTYKIRNSKGKIGYVFYNYE